jgi:hypothetical protein
MTSWQHERSMTPRQYEHTIELLGLSQNAAGRFLGVSERTSRRYVAGETMIPAAHVLLLNAMLAHSEKPVVPRRSSRQT